MFFSSEIPSGRKRLRFRFASALILAAIVPVFLSTASSAKTYVLTNGNRSIVCTPISTFAEEIPETVAEPNDSSTPEVFLICHGEKQRVSSSGETVGQLLARLGITLSGSDVLSHDPDTPVVRGMHLQIDSVITRQETYTATVPHETVRCADASLPEGSSQVLIPGRDGELLCTADVTYRNGRETNRQVRQETMTIVPVTEVIGYGTGTANQTPPAQDMPVIHDGYIIMPTGEILTYYKTDNVTATGYTHTDAGCDMITATGTTVHYGTAAVDPRFIPYGTRMLIVSHDGKRYYGIATAEDCGGAIKRDRMDLYFPTYQECIEFGKRRCTIYFLG